MKSGEACRAAGIATECAVCGAVGAEMSYVGFERTGIPYLRAKRTYGESHYNLWRMARSAVGGILASSTFPLRLILYLAAFIGLAFPVAVLAFGLSAEASTRLGVIGAFYFLLVSVPFIALYLARAYKNGVGRPVFVIDRDRTFLA